jgi:hypothetical protein
MTGSQAVSSQRVCGSRKPSVFASLLRKRCCRLKYATALYIERLSPVAIVTFYHSYTPGTRMAAKLRLEKADRKPSSHSTLSVLKPHENGETAEKQEKVQSNTFLEA